MCRPVLPVKILLVISAFAALAGAGAAFGEPVSLSDAQLANVAAGYYETFSSDRNAIVVGDAASADVHLRSTVGIGAESQNGAKAVTLVNGANSSVANGGNIWSGRETAMIGNAVSSLDQSNQILQASAVAAYVAVWQSQGENRFTRKTETFNSEFTGRIIPQVFTFTGSVITGTTETDADGNSSTTTSTSQTIETLRIGAGAALAGEIDVEAGGAGVTFSDLKKATLVGTATTTAFWGLISSTETTTVTRVEQNSGSVTLLPFSLHATGVICVALVGSCQADAGSFSSASQSLETTRQPARLQGASAGHIVMSDGVLSQITESRVTLEGNAQRNVAALNAANVAATTLANGVNVATGGAQSAAAVMRQGNAITQRR